jgi:PAS domain S-box-containing protein
VVLLTSLSDPMDIIRGLECGADNFLTKPYLREHLLERLELLLATRRARAGGRVRAGVQVLFMGREFTISSDREQILDLLVTTFEEAVRQNRELRRREEELTAAKAEVSRYAESLESRFRLLFDNNPLPMWLYDLDTLQFLEVNDRAVQHYGYTRSEFLAMRLPDIRPPEEVPRLLSNLAQRRGVIEVTEEWKHRKKDGEIIDVRIISHVLQVGGRNTALVVAEDVTERKRLEAQMRQAQKMEAVGRLAGGIAHDFNNLLTAILGETELALLDLASDHPLAETMREVRRQAERAAALTRQLLSFSRRQLVEPTHFNLNELVQDVERMLRRVIGEDIELVLRLDPALGVVFADRALIEQVLVNLAVNARDAMPQGGRLTLETANLTLDETYVERHPYAKPGAYVMLAVTDTGVGMTDEVQAHVFEPFFTTKEPGKGTGLGLATSFGIVKQAGGHIGVYSEPGLGSTFRVYLPRSEAAPAPAGAVQPGPPRGNETILMVEDDQSVRKIGARVLRAQGYVVLETASADEALRAVAAHAGPIHLLMTDVVLPGMSGREVADRVRAARPGVRILFTSGYTSDDAVQQRLLDQAVAFLQKPFSRDLLCQKVRQVLDAPPHPPAGTP